MLHLIIEPGLPAIYTSLFWAALITMGVSGIVAVIMAGFVGRTAAGTVTVLVAVGLFVIGILTMGFVSISGAFEQHKQDTAANINLQHEVQRVYHLNLTADQTTALLAHQTTQLNDGNTVGLRKQSPGYILVRYTQPTPYPLPNR